MRKLIIFFLKGYQLMISPLLPPSCRFYPSCSEYALNALQRFGLSKGIMLTLMRLLRCNPFSRGGYDPIPEKGRENG